MNILIKIGIVATILLMSCQPEKEKKFAKNLPEDVSSDADTSEAFAQVEVVPSSEFDPVRIKYAKHYKIEMRILDFAQMRDWAAPLFKTIDTSKKVDSSNLFCVIRISVDQFPEMSPHAVEFKILDDDFDKENAAQVKFTMFRHTDERYEILTMSELWPPRREALLNKKHLQVLVENIWLK